MLFREFKNFAFKGNLIDMAVGILIGSTFGTVVKSLVDNIFMPPLGILTGRVNFSGKFVALDGGHYQTLDAARRVSAPVLAYGQFVTDLLSFLVTAFAVFVMIKKAIGALIRHSHEKAAAPPPLTRDQELLTQIRDLLQRAGTEPPAG